MKDNTNKKEKKFVLTKEEKSTIKKLIVDVAKAEGVKADTSFGNIVKAKCCIKMSAFEVGFAKEAIIKEAEEEGVEPKLAWWDIARMHERLQKRTFQQKRESIKQIKVNGFNLFKGNNVWYFDSSTLLKTDEMELKEASKEKMSLLARKHLFEVAVPFSDMLQTCEAEGYKVITFDPVDLPIPLEDENGEELEREERALLFKKELFYLYMQGLTDKYTNEKYFPIGLSASKARSGGIVWLVNTGNWTKMEKLRAKCLHLSYKEYLDKLKEDCVMSKFETGHIGMRTSSVINVSKAGIKLRGSDNVLKNIRFKKVNDVSKKVQLNTMEPDLNREIKREEDKKFRPFNFKKTKRDYEVIYSDGSSLIKLQAYVDILYQAGEITSDEYCMFTTKWFFCDYNPEFLKTDEELYKFLTGRNFKSVAQVRFFGGVKGMIIPVAEMDGDPRLADVDMLVFEKSMKYASYDAPFEVINFSHKKERAQLNYQFIQSTVTNPDVLIKGAERAFQTVKDAFSNIGDALSLVGAVRGMSDDGDPLLTKLANDLEIEPRLIREHYHHNMFLEKIEKYVKKVGFGNIPVKGAFKYIISDPLYLYHSAMGDKFESALDSGEVYCNHINGFEAGMWRSPMIHFSEPQKVKMKDVDYLWMYKDIIVLNTKDAIAPALGGADFDGDKCLLVVDYKDGSFESDFVQEIKDTDYIIYDEGNVAKKGENTISNRITYYVNVSTPNRTGQITNWATTFNDKMINAILNGNKKKEWYGRVLIRLRFAQGWEIDLPKTGVSADGPKGDMLPFTMCNPFEKPNWLAKKLLFEGRMSIEDFKKAEEDKKIYASKAPMQVLCDYAEKFWEELSSKFAKDKKATNFSPMVMSNVIGASLTKEEIDAFNRIKGQVAQYEAMFRNEIRNIIELRNHGSSSENDNKDEKKQEQEDMFEMLFEKHRNCLNSLLGGDVTTDVVAYACYHVANIRKNKNGGDENIGGKRSYGWVCYYPETVALLYRNNNGASLVALPDKEITSVEIKEGMLYINEEKYKKTTHPDGSYSVKEIDGRPFIVVPKVLPEITEEEKRKAEIAYEQKEYMFKCDGFTDYRQKLNSEELMEVIKENGNTFDIVQLNSGEIDIAINNIAYARIKELEEYSRELIGKKVVLVNCSDLLRVAKVVNKNTLMKNAKLAYNKMLTFTVMIKGDAESTEVAEQSSSYANYDNSYADIPADYYDNIATDYAYDDSYSDYAYEDSANYDCVDYNALFFEN